MLNKANLIDLQDSLVDEPYQLVVSRTNGSRGGGPKTEEGKARSSQNALKHGYRSRKFLVVDPEDEEEFEHYREAMHASLRPSDEIQSALAELIVKDAWRLRDVVDFQGSLMRENRASGEAFHHAFTATPQKLATLNRYETNIALDLQRNLKNLAGLQKDADRLQTLLAKELEEIEETKQNLNTWILRVRNTYADLQHTLEDIRQTQAHEPETTEIHKRTPDLPTIHTAVDHLSNHEPEATEIHKRTHDLQTIQVPPNQPRDHRTSVEIERDEMRKREREESSWKPTGAIWRKAIQQARQILPDNPD